MRVRPVILALMVLAFGARSYRLDFQPLWFDEGYTLFFATLPGASISAGGAEPHPPLYFLLFKLWTLGAGFGDFSARYLSVIFGTLQVPLAWQLGRRLSGRSAGGLLAAAAVAVNPFLWSHSREARMYSLVPALALGFSLALVRGWSDQASPKNRWFLAGTLLAGLYSHYFFALFALMPALIVLLRKPALRPAVVLPGAAYLPWVIWAGPDLLRGAGSRGESYQPLAPPDYFLGYLHTAAAGEACGAGCPTGTAGVALLTAGIAVAIVTARRRPELGILLAGLGAGLALGFGLQLRYPFGGYVRLQSPTIPVLLTLGVTGSLNLLPAGARLGLTGSALLVAGLALVGAPGTMREYRENLRPLEDYRHLARWLAANAWPVDLVVCDFPWQVGYFLAYLPEPRPSLLYPPNPFGGDSPFRRKTEVWYPAYQALGGTGGGGLEGLLRNRLVPAENRWFGNTRLLRFAPGSTQARWGRAEGPGRPPRLVSWSLPAAAVDAGRTAVVSVEWGLGDIPRSGLKAFVHLATVDEAIVAQADVSLDEFPGTWIRVGLPVPPGTPAGEYRVWAGLYRADTGERLEVGPQPTPDRRLLLGTVTVGRPEIPPRPDFPPGAIVPAAETHLGPLRILGLELFNVTSPQLGDRFRAGDVVELRVYLAGADFAGRLTLRAEVDGQPSELGSLELSGCYPPYCRLPIRFSIPAGRQLRLLAVLNFSPAGAELGRWNPGG